MSQECTLETNSLESAILESLKYHLTQEENEGRKSSSLSEGPCLEKQEQSSTAAENLSSERVKDLEDMRNDSFDSEQQSMTMEKGMRVVDRDVPRSEQVQSLIDNELMTEAVQLFLSEYLPSLEWGYHRRSGTTNDNFKRHACVSFFDNERTEKEELEVGSNL